VVQVCSVSVFGLLVAEVHLGIGEHFGSMHLMMNYEAILHRSWYHAWLMLIGISSVKVSVGLFLLRLVQGKWYKVCSSEKSARTTSDWSSAYYNRVDNLPTGFDGSMFWYLVSSLHA
jgi:hypothetical protein